MGTNAEHDDARIVSDLPESSACLEVISDLLASQSEPAAEAAGRWDDRGGISVHPLLRAAAYAAAVIVSRYNDFGTPGSSGSTPSFAAPPPRACAGCVRRKGLRAAFGSSNADMDER